MSRENLEIVRRGYEAFVRGDIPAVQAVLAPDLVVYRAPPQPDAGTWHGPGALFEALEQWTTDFDDFETEPERFVDAGKSQVLVRAAQRAVGSASGVPIEATFWFVYTLRDRKVTRIDIFAREDQALEAVGLRDQRA